jgi:hypothetical protein
MHLEWSEKSFVCLAAISKPAAGLGTQSHVPADATECRRKWQVEPGSTAAA